MPAGAGNKAGIAYGSTGELGCAAAENPLGGHDFQATPARAGYRSLRLKVKYQGVDGRLTGISGEVVNGIPA